MKAEKGLNILARMLLILFVISATIYLCLQLKHKNQNMMDIIQDLYYIMR